MRATPRMRTWLGRGALCAALAMLLAPAPALADPQANFTFSPTSPVSGDVVTFTSTSTPNGSPLVSYEWDIGNNGTTDATGQSATWSFSAPGSHPVRLTVRAQNGDSDDRTRTVTVRNRPPTASFTYSPSPPTKGEVVTFNSNSSDLDGRIVSHAWDLDADGAFDDATDTITSRVFPEAGGYSVGLRVTDDRGEASTTVVSIPVVESRQPQQALFMTPFPIVRIQGRAIPSGARITRLSVQAPAGSRVRVTCRGKRRNCPKRRTVNRTLAPTSNGRTPVVRIRRMERRLRAGAIIRVYVTGDGVIGKYARFTIRRRRAPQRRDLCLMPGSMRPARCPSG
jgi:PKD repeat protein